MKPIIPRLVHGRKTKALLGKTRGYQGQIQPSCRRRDKTVAAFADCKQLLGLGLIQTYLSHVA